MLKEKSAAYYEILKKLAKETGNDYLDVGIPLHEKAMIIQRQSELHTVFSDGVHLNEVGALILSGEVLRFFGLLKAY